MVEQDRLLGDVDEGTGKFSVGPQPSKTKRVGAFFERRKVAGEQRTTSRIQREEKKLQQEREKFNKEKMLNDKKRQLRELKLERKKLRAERTRQFREKFQNIFAKKKSSMKPRQSDDYMITGSGENRRVQRIGGPRKKQNRERKKKDDFLGDFGGDLI